MHLQIHLLIKIRAKCIVVVSWRHHARRPASAAYLCTLFIYLFVCLFVLCRSGDDKATPDNPAIKKSLSAMLTPYLAKQLGKDAPQEVSFGSTSFTIMRKILAGHWTIRLGIQPAGCNKSFQSLVFVLRPLHFGQWSSLSFCPLFGGPPEYFIFSYCAL